MNGKHVRNIFQDSKDSFGVSFHHFFLLKQIRWLLPCFRASQKGCAIKSRPQDRKELNCPPETSDANPQIF